MAIVKNAPAEMNTNLSLGFVEKQRFTIENDPNRVIYLNLSDMNIAVRLETIYPQILEVIENVQRELDETPDTVEGLSQLAEILTKYDNELRNLMDKLFDAEVSKACAPSGTLYDLCDGEFRFQRILEMIVPLYSTNLDNEMAKMKKKTEKYVKKYHK